MPRIDVGKSENRDFLWFRVSTTSRRSINNGRSKLKQKYRVELNDYNQHGPYKVSFNGSGTFWEYIYTVKGYKYP